VSSIFRTHQSTVKFSSSNSVSFTFERSVVILIQSDMSHTRNDICVDSTEVPVALNAYVGLLIFK